MDENKSLKTKNTVSRVLLIVGGFFMLFSQIMSIPFFIIPIFLSYKKEDVDMSYHFLESIILLVINILYAIFVYSGLF